MTNVKSILFVPAWWPCGFFKDQQDITADEYRPYILYGSCKEIPLKNYVRAGFKGQSYSESFDGNVSTISYSWVKFRQTSLLNRQRQKLSEKIGKSILQLTNGTLPTLVHIQSISETAVFVMDWAYQNHIPVVLTEHLIYIRRSLDYLTRLKESLYNRVNQVLCVSNYLYRNLLTSGFTLPRAKVIGNMIDDRFVPIDFSYIKKNGRVLFVAGHLNDKAFDVLVMVAKRLKNLGVKIDVIGLTGEECLPHEKSAQQQVNDAEVNDVITFMGRRTHEELLKTYSNYSLLLSTSRSETFGLSVAEAIAYGTKVVCADSGGIRDFVNDNNGFVTDIGDISELCKLIKCHIDDVYNLQNESKQVLEDYASNVYKSKLLKFYLNIL